MLGDVNDKLVNDELADRLNCTVEGVRRAHSRVSRNVSIVLRRQVVNTINQNCERPTCEFLGERELGRALGRLALETALTTLARIYDEAHVALCKALSAARRGRYHNEAFRRSRCVDLRHLTIQFDDDHGVVQDDIILEPDHEDNSRLRARWKPITPMTFDNCPQLESLSDILPGETSFCHEYAGIGGGGGSDIISASLLGHLLRRHGKEMNLLISTRTWATGSQGKKNSRLGVKREIYNHGGPVQVNGKPIAGTFKINGNTYAEGRDLESIPHSRHSQIFMVLDQGESTVDIPDDERANLKDQFDAVLAQAKPGIESVLIIDTGGDVFGADTSGATTPDQDLRVQKAMCGLSANHNLITAVVTPGVDAPTDAPQKAFKAGGMVYKPTKEEMVMLLDLLAREYKMDGSDPSRFGKTTLALQARLRGVIGWTSLDLPDYVIDTWDNPWSSFVYIRECMSDIILMPTTKLLPLIEPINS